jgi:hypothetical protein
MRFSQLRPKQNKHTSILVALFCLPVALQSSQPSLSGQIGREVGIQKHLQDGQEFNVPAPELIEFGRKLFTAVWTRQEGAGRPLTKGTGATLSDLDNPLIFPRNFNRISGPDANSCAGCHNSPFIGGVGDIATNAFVLGQRFDYATFNHVNDAVDFARLNGSDRQVDFATFNHFADSIRTAGATD